MISALGLDIGRRRIGVAGCDATGLIATGLTTIERTTWQQDLAQLERLAQVRQVQVLVAGLPYSMNGTLGFQARQVQKFAQRLSAALHLPLEYVDERLTSVEAEQLLRSRGSKGIGRSSQQKGLIDRMAAALILQQWLDQQRQQRSHQANRSRAQDAAPQST